MSSTSRFTAPIFRTIARAVLMAACAAGIAASSQALNVVLGNQTLSFTHINGNAGVTAIGIEDPAFRKLLEQTGTVMTWKRGERYVLFTTSEPRVISFSVGDRTYQTGALTAQAPAAPFLVGDEVYLPLDDLLHALSYALRSDGAATVLQPQLSTLDVRTSPGGATIVARAGRPLAARVLQDTPQKVTYAFDGVGTTLAANRAVNAGGIASIAVSQTGSARAPRTLVVVTLVPGAQHGAPKSDNDRDFAVSVTDGNVPAPPVLSGPAGATPSGTQLVTPVPQPQSASLASVSGVDVQSSQNGLSITIHVDGNAAFEWHRLRDPDNRFWVDVKGAQLTAGEQDNALADPGVSLRVKQLDPQTVRVAISLASPKQISVFPATTGLVVSVGTDEDLDAARQGAGTVGSVVAAGDQVAPVTPAPGDLAGSTSPVDVSGYAAGPYVAANPRLIVIDPGHGGSDTGAQRGELSEAAVNLDVAGRLRTILQQRGWQVRMTRTSDVDVFRPNDSAHDELQARVDVANTAGARMFVSIHANSFINAGPSGTTTYYSKPSDVPLARIVQATLMSASLGTKDDGTVKSHLYVTYHTLMPAILIETAFLSNPDDYALLASTAWRQRVAEAIANGIDRYAQQYPAGGKAQ